ncbi:MAG: PAS domain S-box protein [Actinobacteria bacterium]|jgi:PAS domain S-box-containing protein|nr:MAG: PAS domain S-box protein [Actinomycetota bacterium]
MEKQPAAERRDIAIYWQLAIGAAVFAALFVISRYNYLLFHGIAEIFSSLVAFTIFILAWHTRRYMENDYLLFLGIAYLFVGILDLVHMFAYSGMGVFEGYGANLATQLWIAARYLEAFSLLLAPLFITRRLRPRLDVAVYAAVVTLLLLSILYWDIFPTCFVEGVGLTLFKRISEYVISFILALAIGELFRKRGEFDARVFRLVVASIALTIVSELCFTLYQDPYAFFNLLGHYFKIVSFYLIYRAIVETGLEEPYEILFRKLNEKERRERAILDATADSLILQDLDGRILAINAVAARNLGGSVEELVGAELAGLMPSGVYGKMQAVVEEMIGENVTVRREEELEGRWYEETYYPVFDEEGGVGMLAVYSRDISERKQAERALAASRERWQKSFDAIGDAMLVLDGEMRILQHNDALCELLGRREDFTGRRCYELIHGLDEPPGFCVCGEAMACENRVRKDVYEPVLDKHLWISFSPVFDERGEMEFGVHVIQDISERKRAEEDTRESEERLRTMADASGDFIMMLDREHRIRFINRTEQGLDPDSIVGTPLYELVDSEDQGHVRARLDEVIRNADRQEYETVFHRPDGTDIYYSSVAVPLVVGGGVIGSVVNSRDITGRKSMEEALRESEEKFRSIVEQSGDGIVLVDKDGVIIEWNSAQETIVGLGRDEAVGKPLWEVQYRGALPEQKTPEYYERLKGSILASLERGYASWFGETSEREIQSPDGERRIVQAVTFPIRSSEGMMVGSITRDITRRVRMEEMLAFELEVNQAVAELSATLLAQASIDDISYIVLENAKRLTASPFGFVGYIENDTGFLVSPTLTRDIWEECGIAGKSVVFKEFKGLWGWVLENKKPLLTNGPREDPRSTGVPDGHIPIERFVAVPALLGGALVGQIALANSSRDYDERDITLLNRLADLYAMAVLRMWSEGELDRYREHLEELVRERTLELERINRQLQEEVSQRRRNQEELRTTADQLRALSAHVESVREEERRHVAREVHDTLGQALTGLKINLSLLGRRLAGDDELVERIGSMSGLVDATIQSVREISTQLRPGVLDDLGLSAALDWQVKRFGELTGLKSVFVSDSDEDILDKDLTIALFRIAQEALTNVARHAEASRVEVRLAHEAGGVMLEIKDDGRGIGEAEAGRWDALGILGMRERAHVFGGEVEVQGSSGAGTIVTVRIPLDAVTPREDGAVGGEDGG